MALGADLHADEQPEGASVVERGGLLYERVGHACNRFRGEATQRAADGPRRTRRAACPRTSSPPRTAVGVGSHPRATRASSSSSAVGK